MTRDVVLLMRTRWLRCWAALAAVPALALAETPAEQKIAAARRALDGGNLTPETYNALGLALARRARESADPRFYEQANEAVAESLRLAPGNFDARKTRVWILLGQHEFAEAVREATDLNRRMPDDPMLYAMLVDAHVELGNYEDAETAAQWLLDLRPGNVIGLGRAAYLRELFGDLEGAIELMTQAYARTPPTEVEDRAWLLTQIGHLHRVSGAPTAAEAAVAEALRAFPGYHYALAEMAKIRIAQKRYSEAVTWRRQHYAAAPHPENLYALAEALKLDRRHREAKAAFADFETLARAESDSVDNANRELVMYYVDHARQPAEALRIAELEMKRRPNIETRHCYAWALFANGRTTEARTQMERALAVGTRDPVLLEHARQIGVKPVNAAPTAAPERIAR